jgi:hypothetical protein
MMMASMTAKQVRRAAFASASATMLACPAMGAEIPALSAHWGRTNFNLEQPSSGPVFISNTMKKPDGTIDDDAARVGDFTNPILTPQAAQILREHGEFSRAGNSIPDPHNQCWPEPPPFVMAIQVEVLLLQHRDEITLVYVNGQVVRHVRLNAAHAQPMTPSWQGDSVGHYEGDTLVIDTIGIKPQGPLAVIDRYGTPFSDALHVVERYRLIDGAEAVEAMRKHRRTFTADPAQVRFDIYGAEFDWDAARKGLQVEVTVEDPKTFTQPWKGLVTYRPQTRWPEMVCAENLRESTGPDRDVPVAETPDF